ncbi:NucA/NucB deoxyribonuclease domain-containing protein [Streptomyces glomeratus]|uniref:Deoxyribonuclease NucA/NucB domain-containing protein n=1 Tax=Streptomyces glomeratus TaxID=284452 RepID=A0ABP6L652_9ACTN|nr:NucA/NucB deoxyribonuclease domain-containing protein [Streptomyces glomeratus]MCF1507177.1 NucA/NucB deoxyribonuclease domain-containing protein [Streptomyces glomeratus]
MNLRTRMKTGLLGVTGAALLVGGLTAAHPATAQPSAAVNALSAMKVDAVKTAHVDAAGVLCKIGYITITRTSMCLDVNARVDVLRNGRPVGSATFEVKHSMTLKTNKLKWGESFTVGKARLVNASGISVSVSVGAGKGVKTSVKFPQGSRLGPAHKGSVSYSASVKKHKQLSNPASYRFTFTKPGYTIGTGGYKSAKFRCDDTFWSRDDTKRVKNPGCVFPGYAPVFSLSRSDSKVKESAKHILDAQRAITGHPGASTPLHRITDEKTIDKHRRAMCGRTHAPSGKDCDEYPFAATKEGGNPRRGSIRVISASDNRSAGARLGGFYKSQRVLGNDAYYVRIK